MSIFGHRETFKLVFQSRSQSLNICKWTHKFWTIKKKIVVFCHKLYDQNETKIHINDAIVMKISIWVLLEGQSS